MSGSEQIVVAAAVLQPEDAVAVLGPPVRRLVRGARQQRGKQNLLPANRVHLVAHDLLDLAQHPQTQRQPAVQAGPDRADVAGPDQQLVAGDLGVGRVVAQRAQEQLGHAGDHSPQAYRRPESPPIQATLTRKTSVSSGSPLSRWPQIFEDQPRADGEVSHGAAGQHLTRSGHRADSRTDVHRHAAPLVAALLALADVHAGADRDAVGGQRGHQVQTAPGGLRRAVEQREDTVAGVLGPPTAVPRQHRVDQPVVVVEMSTPVIVALRRRAVRSSRRCR